MHIDFVKGHCGWDTLTLIPEGQIPAGQEREAALKILDAPINGGLEVGFLGSGANPGEITLRMLDSTSRDWLPMCGGMTQVIGKALVETFFRDRFDIDINSRHLTFRLLTKSGVIPIEIDVRNGEAVRITSIMDDYVTHLYRESVEDMTLRGCRCMRVGDFIVIEVSRLEALYPGLDFTRRDPGPHLDTVNNILRDYMGHVGAHFGVAGMLYDQRPQGPGHFRLYPRFFSADLAAARVPYEFQCGTGTVAVGVVLVHDSRLPFRGKEGAIVFEWGNQTVTADPYGIRTSRLDLCVEDRRVTRARFSHSVVEILQEGRIRLPGYNLTVAGQS